LSRNVISYSLLSGLKFHGRVMGSQVILVMVFIIYLAFGIFTIVFSSTTGRAEYETLKSSREFLPLLYYGHGIFFAVALITVCWTTIIYWTAVSLVTQLSYSVILTKLGQ